MESRRSHRGRHVGRSCRDGDHFEFRSRELRSCNIERCGAEHHRSDRSHIGSWCVRNPLRHGSHAGLDRGHAWVANGAARHLAAARCHGNVHGQLDALDLTTTATWSTDNGDADHIERRRPEWARDRRRRWRDDRHRRWIRRAGSLRGRRFSPSVRPRSSRSRSHRAPRRCPTVRPSSSQRPGRIRMDRPTTTTSSVTWASSAPMVFSISNSGGSTGLRNRSRVRIRIGVRSRSTRPGISASTKVAACGASGPMHADVRFDDLPRAALALRRHVRNGHRGHERRRRRRHRQRSDYAGGLVVLLGNGDGTFTNAGEFPSRSASIYLSIGDVNNDAASSTLSPSRTTRWGR